ncbi:MAG: hypothetical protein E6J34_08880 [Chloroflexi bacterium]|nr:MAG: hypothetical protein E6J34_08880 [Chloroflexota bacterium]
MLQLDLAPEHLYVHAQQNLLAMSLAGLLYAKARGGSATDFVEFVGEKAIPCWEPIRGLGAFEMLHEVSVNLAAAGGQVLALSGNAAQAEAALSDWVSDDVRTILGLSRDDTDALWDLYKPIATYLELQYTWARVGEHFVVKVRQ